jgi:LysM repeat protein
MPLAKDEPLPLNSLRDKGKNKDKNLKPATSGFDGFWQELSYQKRVQERQLKSFLKFVSPVTDRIQPFTKPIANIFELNKKLFWPLFLLLIMVFLPWISKASMSAQTEAELKAYAQPMDPIKTGQLAMSLNQFMPEPMYADPDVVVISQMTKNESYTLAQQLSINEGNNVGAPERQAPTYELKSGETVTQVAGKFNLHVGTILEANGIKPEDLKKIKPGTVLKIPSSDTDTSDAWLVALNKAEADAKAKAQAEAEAKKKKAAQVAMAASTSDDNSISTTLTRRGTGYGSVTVIGTSYEQCLPWARAQTGIQIHGYAGNVAATQSEPRVGGIALDRFFGHASVVVGVGEDTITVHEANFIRGKITERVVSKAAIRGYVY